MRSGFQQNLEDFFLPLPETAKFFWFSQKFIFGRSKFSGHWDVVQNSFFFESKAERIWFFPLVFPLWQCLIEGSVEIIIIDELHEEFWFWLYFWFIIFSLSFIFSTPSCKSQLQQKFFKKSSFRSHSLKNSKWTFDVLSYQKPAFVHLSTKRKEDFTSWPFCLDYSGKN